jgi:hypothetical protein
MVDQNTQPPRFYQDTTLWHGRNDTIIFSNGDHQLATPDALPQRPANFNQYGKACNIILNTFNLEKIPQTLVHQYDVSLPSAPVLTPTNLPSSTTPATLSTTPSASSSARSGTPARSSPPSVSPPTSGSATATSWHGPARSLTAMTPVSPSTSTPRRVVPPRKALVATSTPSTSAGLARSTSPT